MRTYYRPIVQSGPLPEGALPLAGGPLWFHEVECLAREGAQKTRIPADDLPDDWRSAITQERAMDYSVAGRPSLMGILNVTPDSFSDGGRFCDKDRAVEQAKMMIEAGADILDIGGESTRPGAAEVAIGEETERTVPVIKALRESGIKTPISVDTRKAAVARDSLNSGANIVNDVSALGFDSKMARFVANAKVPVCLMHAQGTPETMQISPEYRNVLLDVYDDLERLVAQARSSGISREKIIVDPGIGFGKTLEHNLILLRGLALFHGLGCPILLGASRKRFIGKLSSQSEADKRGPGSVAVALEAARQGIQIIRAHDIEMHAQAFAIWAALNETEKQETGAHGHG